MNVESLVSFVGWRIETVCNETIFYITVKVIGEKGSSTENEHGSIQLGHWWCLLVCSPGEYSLRILLSHLVSQGYQLGRVRERLSVGCISSLHNHNGDVACNACECGFGVSGSPQVPCSIVISFCSSKASGIDNIVESINIIIESINGSRVSIQV